MRDTTVGEAVTAREIARTIGQPFHKVAYVLDSRQIEPLRRVGIVRLYSPAIISMVQEEIDGRRQPARTESNG